LPAYIATPNRWEKTTPVAVKIKLKRLGKIRAPYYRIIVADARTKRDGRAIEEIGKYHPKSEPSFIEVNSERAQHWLSVGAQPTDPVRKLLEITGDWQKFKGLPGAEGTLRAPAPRENRKEIFEAAVKENMGDAAPTPKSKGRARSGEAKSGDAKSGAAKTGDGAAARGEKAAKQDAPAKGAKASRPKAARQASGEAGEAGEAGDAGDAKPQAAAAATSRGEAGQAAAQPAGENAGVAADPQADAGESSNTAGSGGA
jgi:small subunit ribosomal protein S16